MKPLLFGALLVISACQNAPTTAENVIKIDSIDSPLTRIDICKDLSDSIFHYVELVDMGMMSKKKLSKIADPMQRRFDSVFNLLSHSDKQVIKDYRANLVNGMMDRKVERDRKQ